MEIPGRCCEVSFLSLMDSREECVGDDVLILVPDSRRDGRLRVPHITPGRRLPGDNSPRPRRPRRLMRRPSSSWLSTATRHLRFLIIGKVWVVGFLGCLRFPFEHQQTSSMLWSALTGRCLKAGSTSHIMHGTGGCYHREKSADEALGLCCV